MPNDIEKTLRDMGKNDKTEYPRDLKSATRDEFTTNVRMANKKGPGCPLFASVFLLIIGLMIYIF